MFRASFAKSARRLLHARLISWCRKSCVVIFFLFRELEIRRNSAQRTAFYTFVHESVARENVFFSLKEVTKVVCVQRYHHIVTALLLCYNILGGRWAGSRCDHCRAVSGAIIYARNHGVSGNLVGTSPSCIQDGSSFYRPISIQCPMPTPF